MMNLIVPLSVAAPAEVQFVVLRSWFCCNVKPVEGEGQETTTMFVVVRAMVTGGLPGDGTTASKLQKPPISEYCPPVIGPPASGWPMVPLTAYTPPVLVPPPPSMVNQSMAKLCAR